MAQSRRIVFEIRQHLKTNLHIFASRLTGVWDSLGVCFCFNPDQFDPCSFRCWAPANLGRLPPTGWGFGMCFLQKRAVKSVKQHLNVSHCFPLRYKPLTVRQLIGLRRTKFEVLELSGAGTWRLVPADTYEFGQI